MDALQNDAQFIVNDRAVIEIDGFIIRIAFVAALIRDLGAVPGLREHRHVPGICRVDQSLQGVFDICPRGL